MFKADSALTAKLLLSIPDFFADLKALILSHNQLSCLQGLPSLTQLNTLGASYAESSSRYGDCQGGGRGGGGGGGGGGRGGEGGRRGEEERGTKPEPEPVLYDCCLVGGGGRRGSG